MKVKSARKLIAIIAIVGFILSLIGGYVYEPLFIVGIIVMVCSLIPQFLFNKCPHCGKNLGRNVGPFCQFCGKEYE